MRLAKKIAAIVLAAAMSVSMLTACGGGGSSTGGSNSSSGSKPSSSSSSASSSASSSSSSSSTSSGSSSTASSDSSSGSTSGGETIDYAKSRTVKFFQKLGDNFTVDLKVTEEHEYGTYTRNMLISTNGNRLYAKVTEDNTSIDLRDKTQKKDWVVIPATEEVIFSDIMPGEYGYYYVPVNGASDWDNDDLIYAIGEPAPGVKFTKETKGSYYVETQTLEPGGLREVFSYWYEGNSSVPKYIYIYAEAIEGNKKVDSWRREINSVEFKARDEYMNFESILSKCTDVTDLLYPKDDTQS